jgi:hypothetical protein
MTESNSINREVTEISSLPKNVRFIQGVYWFLVVGGLIAFIEDLVGGSAINELSLTTAINLLILYGLQKRKQWVVSLVLFFSAWTLFSSFLRVVGETAATSDMLKQKVAALLFALFSIYQLYIFRGKEAKLYFSQKGQTLY